MDQETELRSKKNAKISRNFWTSGPNFFSFQGVKFKILSYQTPPWVTLMKKRSDSEDAYEFSGPMPDVWFALQVSIVKKNSNNKEVIFIYFAIAREH